MLQKVSKQHFEHFLLIKFSNTTHCALLAQHSVDQTAHKYIYIFDSWYLIDDGEKLQITTKTLNYCCQLSTLERWEIMCRKHGHIIVITFVFPLINVSMYLCVYVRIGKDYCQIISLIAWIIDYCAFICHCHSMPLSIMWAFSSIIGLKVGYTFGLFHLLRSRYTRKFN